MAVLVPVYWHHYGLTNFLYFCDVALFLTLVGIWLESRLLLSMALIGIFLPQVLWVVDFLGCFLGTPLVGMAQYMFHSHKPVYLRSLSLFHGWLPFLLLWLVLRLGYDRKAFWWWTVLAWVLLAIGYWLLPAPPAPADDPNLPVNVNYVYGLSDDKPQTWMPAHAWFAFLMIGLPVLIYLPTHWLISAMDRRWGRAARTHSSCRSALARD